MITTNNVMIAELITLRVNAKVQDSKIDTIECAIDTMQELRQVQELCRIDSDLAEAHVAMHHVLDEAKADLLSLQTRLNDYTEEYEATFGNSYMIDTVTGA